MSVEEIMELDISERIVLVEEIWDSIAREEPEISLAPEEKKILDERLCSLESSPDELLSWDQIKRAIRG
jgi:putative addiction module component (TIGR02574 family)